MGHKVICTAGHIDHGKTALVKAITGMDTDRLEEEISRGITIDLGFAFYGDQATIIDLPGHEKFIRNMVAGAATVDYALLVIAADDGLMPQSIEHLDILDLLGIKRGLIVLSKADLVEEEWLELVEDEVRSKVEGTFLQDAPILKIDSLSGRGIEELKTELDAELDKTQPRSSRPEYRQPIDRAFTIKGFGAVITGTVISGSVKIKDRIWSYPHKKEVKVRGIQIHGKDVSRADTGSRSALNLQGVEKSEIRRGDVLAQPGLLEVADRFDCRVELLPSAAPLKHRQRLRFHLGTAEIMGRILLLEDNLLAPGAGAFAQLELEEPTMALRGDRFVFRTYSPQITIGGGQVLKSSRVKHKRRQKPLFRLFDSLASGEAETIITRLLDANSSEGMTFARIHREGGLQSDICRQRLNSMIGKGEIIQVKAGGDEWFILKPDLNAISEKIIEIIGHHHKRHPDHLGISLAELKSAIGGKNDTPMIEKALEILLSQNKVRRSGSKYTLSNHSIKLSTGQKQLSDKIIELVEAGGFSAPRANPLAELTSTDLNEILDMLAIMENMRALVRLERDIVLARGVFDDAVAKLRQLEADKGIIELPDAIKTLNASRRITVTFLEYLDRTGITERIGDNRRFKR